MNAVVTVPNCIATTCNDPQHYTNSMFQYETINGFK